jgi:3-oxoacyl-[acyl-carrier-protein] synthase II
VLEELEHAKERKAHIYAEYLGGGFSLEGWKVTTPKIGDDSYQSAILEALAVSKRNKDEIDVVCAHGVGNPAIDYYEAKAITDIFGKKQKKPLITTFKPYIGHNLGGSTLIETIVLLLAMENNTVPPVLNTNVIDPRFNIDLVKEKTEIPIRTVLKICCAFAGYNAAVIFQKLKNK